MSEPGRKYNAGSGYRYGFNGKENDNEVKGEGNQQDYGMRIYDPRLGRFLSTDPLTRGFPMLTPYQYAGNSPIANIDLDGEEPRWICDKNGKLREPLVHLLSMWRLSFNTAKTTKAMNSIMYYTLATQEATIKGNQVIHDNITHYSKNSFAAVTIAYDMNFTDGAMASRDGFTWLTMLGHEITHVQQFMNKYGESHQAYLIGYALESAKTAAQYRTLNANILHDKIPMEKEALGVENEFEFFLSYFNMKDAKGNVVGNKVINVLSSGSKFSEKKKIEKINNLIQEYKTKVVEPAQKQAEAEKEASDKRLDQNLRKDETNIKISTPLKQ